MAEILAPAGSMESFGAAVEAGCDAVYLALPKFGARAYAANFDLEQMRQVLKRAKVLGVKVYVAMNTILYEDEVQEAWKQAKTLHEMGVDALIVQDLGFMHLLKHTLPGLEVHASTQLSVNRKEQMERLKKLGIKRTVLARECTLDEIRELSKVSGMETEVFVHGALCISYSGQCRFSQVRTGRSGNRGACAQFCRMEYTLLENGQKVQTEGNYLLSPRDISVLHRIDELERAGVASLKIEGRMKSPVYVYEAVKSARERRRPDKHLKTAFNRTFSEGHLAEAHGNGLMNPVSPNHQGIPIGTVIRADKERVTIRLTDSLHQEDGIRMADQGMRVNFLYDRKGKLINKAEAGETVQVKMRAFVPVGAEVRKTLDAAHVKEVDREIQEKRRKRKVKVSLEGKAGDPLTLTMGDVQVQTIPSQRAKKPADKERISEALAKLGNTPFEAEEVQVNLGEDVFIPIKALNEARREAARVLEKELTEAKPIRCMDYQFQPENEAQWLRMVQIQRPEQKMAAAEGITFISEFPIPGTKKKAAITEESGYVTGHLGEGEWLSDMNITNSYGVAAALEMGYKGVILSPEMSREQVQMLAEGWKERYGTAIPAIVPVYGKARMMLMKHCPVNTALGDGRRQACSLCRQKRYELEGLDGRKVWLYGDAGCRMQLFDDRAEDRLDWTEKLKEAGFAGVKLDMADESPQEVSGLLEQVKIVERDISGL